MTPQNGPSRRSHNAALAGAGGSIIQVHSSQQLKPVEMPDNPAAESRALYRPPQEVHPLKQSGAFRPSSAKMSAKKSVPDPVKGSNRVSNLKGPLQGSLSAATLAPKPAFVMGSGSGTIVRSASPDTRQVANAHNHSHNHVYSGPITKPAEPKQPLRRPAKEAFLEIYTGMKRGGSASNNKTSAKPNPVCPRCGYPFSAPPPNNTASGAQVPGLLQPGQQLANKKNAFRAATGVPGASSVMQARSKSPMPTKEGVIGNFRSEVLNLEVELQERLQGLEEIHGNLDAPSAKGQKLDIFSDIFDAIIGKSKLYGNLLGIIKQEYDFESGRLTSARQRPTKGVSEPCSPNKDRMKSPGDWGIRPRTDARQQRHSSSGEPETWSDDELERLRGENTRLQAETSSSSKKIEEIERAVGLEREAMRHERTAMQQDYMELQSCLAEREQDIQQLGQIITALQRGDIKIEHLRQLDLSGGLYSERAFNEQNEPKSKFADVPVEDVTWEISLSSRGALPRPKAVPFLNLDNIHPPPAPADPPPAEPSAQSLTQSEHSYAGDTPPGDDIQEVIQRPESRAANHSDQEKDSK